MLDEMRMRTACFARAPQRCTIHLSKHFLFTFQEVTPLSKTRNQLQLKALLEPFGLTRFSTDHWGLRHEVAYVFVVFE